MLDCVYLCDGVGRMPKGGLSREWTDEDGDASCCLLFAQLQLRTSDNTYRKRAVQNPQQGRHASQLRIAKKAGAALS